MATATCSSDPVPSSDFIFCTATFLAGMRSSEHFGVIQLEHCFSDDFEAAELELQRLIQTEALKRSHRCNGVVSLDVTLEPWAPGGGCKLTAKCVATRFESW